MTKSKAADPAKGYRNRQGETLFIDARNLGTMINRTTKELTADDIATIADTYHAWRSTPEELTGRVKRGDSKLAAPTVVISRTALNETAAMDIQIHRP